MARRSLDIETDLLNSYKALGLTDEDIERQMRAYYAYSKDSHASLEERIKVQRTDKYTAKNLDSEKERKETKETLENLFSSESTMSMGTDNKNPTKQATYDNLARRYNHKLNLDIQKQEIDTFLADKPIALRSLKHYWNRDISLRILISEWWLAANDINPEILKWSSVEVRRKQFVYALEDTIRSGNRDKKGNDNGSMIDIAPSCGTGFTNKFCEAMFGLHPDNVFVGKIRPMMATLTERTAHQVYLLKLNSERKELFEALKTDTPSKRHEELIDGFLAEVYKNLTINIKKEFGDNEKLFLPLINDYAPTAQYCPNLPTPEEVEKNREILVALKRHYHEILSYYQNDSKQNKEKGEMKKGKEEEELYNKEEPYRCLFTGEFMTDPVKIKGKGHEHHSFERAKLVEWFQRNNTNPKTSVFVEDKTLIPDSLLKDEIQRYLQNKDKKEREDTEPSKTPELAYACSLVFAQAWLNKMPKDLSELSRVFEHFTQEMKNLKNELDNLAMKNADYIKTAKLVMNKLKLKQSVSSEELDPKDLARLEKFWSFNYSADVSKLKVSSREAIAKFRKRKKEAAEMNKKDEQTKQEALGNSNVENGSYWNLMRYLPSFNFGGSKKEQGQNDQIEQKSNAEKLEYAENDGIESKISAENNSESREFSQEEIDVQFALELNELYLQQYAQERKEERSRREQEASRLNEQQRIDEENRRRAEEENRRQDEIRREAEERRLVAERAAQVDRERFEAERIRLDAERAEAERVRLEAERVRLEAERVEAERRRIAAEQAAAAAAQAQASRHPLRSRRV